VLLLLLLAQAAITALGGFQQQPIPGGSLAPVSQLPGNARLLGQSLMVQFGANNPGMLRRAITRAQHIPLVTMTDLHIVGLLLAGAGLVAGIAVWFPARPARIATFALAAYVAIGVAEMGYAAWWPAAPLPVQPVAAWLVAHHQREGLAAYWQATETTVAAGGQVLVAPVTDSADGPVTWNASSDWYRPELYSATFVLTGVDPEPGEPALPLAVIRARFGPPAAEYRVGDDIILTYDYNLLTRLHGDAVPGLS
jgi:hypothetical protein